MEIRKMIMSPLTTTKRIGYKVLCVHCLEEAQVRSRLRDDDEYFCECEGAQREHELSSEIAWLKQHPITQREAEIKKLASMNDEKIKQFLLEADLEAVYRKHGNYQNANWWAVK